MTGNSPGTSREGGLSPNDGRNVDPTLGILEGEAAEQQVPEHRARLEGAAPFGVWESVPSRDRGGGPAAAEPTYYGRPMLKQPVWIWAVPAYFFTGGVAGAAAVLGAAAQASGDREVNGLVTRCRWIAAAGTTAGTGLLIHDLGRPERFLNMLRVFRPSSPLNLGSWVLAAAGPLTVASAVLDGAPGPLGTVGHGAGYAAGAVGLPLAGYTAVLVSTTAVPVWSEIRRTLPSLFVASAVTGAASLLQLLKLNGREASIVRRFAVAGAAADLAAAVAVDRAAGRVEGVDIPLREGLAGSLLRAAKALTAGSLAINLLPGGARWKRTAAGVLGALGSLATKFGVFYAGSASARDPQVAFRQQRTGHGASEVTGVGAVSGPGQRAVP
jgi:formate-dependent nitrite reductase membrane component NrfD